MPVCGAAGIYVGRVGCTQVHSSHAPSIFCSAPNATNELPYTPCSRIILVHSSVPLYDSVLLLRLPPPGLDDKPCLTALMSWSLHRSHLASTTLSPLSCTCQLRTDPVPPCLAFCSVAPDSIARASTHSLWCGACPRYVNRPRPPIHCDVLVSMP